MKNKLIILSLITIAALLTACGTSRKAAGNLPNVQTTTTADPVDAVVSTLGDWQTLQTGGDITLNAGSSFSSSIQVRMVRDQAIYISLRPLLGIEVGKLLITADSVYAVDKVHKRYVAEKVALLTAGIPVTVSDVQDIFLGRPFIIGQGTLSEGLKQQVTASSESNRTVVTANEQYKGYGYAFTLDKTGRIVSLDITPTGGSTADYQVKYADVRSTRAGNIAHSIKVNATIEKKKLDFSLTYKNIDWNGNVKIDRDIPGGYTRMNAKDLFNLFSN